MEKLSANESVVDIWNIDKENISKKPKVENNNSINTEIIQGVKIDQKIEDVIFNQELEASNINLIGLYDPAENGLSIDMWSNSDGVEIKNLLNKLNSKKLSNFSEKILDITLLTNSYVPTNNISVPTIQGRLSCLRQILRL